MAKIQNWKSGFTLIEIIVVVAIIGVLSTWVIVLVNPTQQFKKGRDAERKTELRQIQAALELYRADQGSYPESLPFCGSPLEVNNVIYIQKIPCDPQNKDDFVYQYSSTGTTYSLTACLENINDSQKDEPNDSMICADEKIGRSYTLINP